MKIGSADTGDRVVVVAEIGNNHEGDPALAEELVRLAADAGADVVKFQTFEPERYVTSRDVDRLAQLRKCSLPRATIPRLVAVARVAGVAFVSTPFDLGSAAFLTPFVPVFKIASGDITFFPLIETVARTGKPVVLSTGAATLAEVETAVACVRHEWCACGVASDLAILHCVASYPTPPEQANLAAIMTLRQRFPDCTIGYSDHTIGNDAAVAAVVLGARIIEKHFTITHDHSTFRDHQLSATPDELRTLVARIRSTEAMLGNGEKVPQACELPARTAARRSLAVVRDCAAGTTLHRSDLMWVRPGTGIPPGEESSVIGQVLADALAAGEHVPVAVGAAGRGERT